MRAARDEHLLAFVLARNPAYFHRPPQVEAALQYMWRHDLYELDETVNPEDRTRRRAHSWQV